MVVDKILGALTTIKDPYTSHPFSFSYPPRVEQQGDCIEVNLSIDYPLGFAEKALQTTFLECLEPLVSPAFSLKLSFQTKILSHAVQKDLKPHPMIKNIIAVASGKGGVGKSTVCVNMALALAAQGASVGILDADIYGPSQPTLLGVSEALDVTADKFFIPKRPFGVQMVSMGLLVAKETPMIWRGPMASSALQQLLQQTQWESLDYLLIDLPPGTGDIQLTLCQKIPLTGAIIVTTPQEVAAIDVQKSIEMFKKIEIPVLGLIENMAQYHCKHCGSVDYIFGQGGGEALAEQYQIPLLGSLPLEESIRMQSDLGAPIVVAAPGSAAARYYQESASKMAAILSRRPKNFSYAFSKIVTKEIS